MLKAEITGKAKISETNALKQEFSQIKETTVRHITKEGSNTNLPPKKCEFSHQLLQYFKRKQCESARTTRDSARDSARDSVRNSVRDSARHSARVSGERARGKTENAEAVRTKPLLNVNNNNNRKQNTQDFTLAVNNRRKKRLFSNSKQSRYRI